MTLPIAILNSNLFISSIYEKMGVSPEVSVRMAYFYSFSVITKYKKEYFKRVEGI